MDPLRDIEKTTREINDRMHRYNRTVFGRYPLVFSLLAAFGVVSVLFGFERLLDDVPLFVEHPSIPLIIGIAILIFTGTLYKRLEKKFD